MAKNPYINVYTKTGDLISQGDGSAPLNVGPLNAANNEVSAPIELVIKCEAGFKALPNTVVSFEGATASKWTTATTSGGSYSASITITSEITTTGTSFWVKAASSSDEAPSNDTSVDIKVASVIAAV